MRWLLTFLSLIIGHLVNGQSQPSTFSHDLGERYFAVDVNTGMWSTAATQSFAYGIATGKQLSSEDKEFIANRLRKKNRGGYKLNLQLEAGYRIGKRQWLIRLSDNSMGFADVSKDMLNLVLHGNGPYEDDSLKLDGTSFGMYRYQEFGIGYVFDKIHCRTSLMLSLLNGIRGMDASIERGRIFTPFDGEFLFADARGSFFSSDTNDVSSFTSNGLGAALSLYHTHHFNSRATLRIGVQRLGFIQWRAPQYNLSVNQQYQLNPYYVDFGRPNQIEIDFNDSLNTYSEALTSNTKMIPAHFFASLNLAGPGKWSDEIGMEHWVNAGYTPSVYYRRRYRVNQRLTATANLGFGGYTKMSFGLGTEYQYNGFRAVLRLDHLEGVVAPKWSAGSSAQVILIYNL